jgi:hypothetical protein
LIRVHISLIYSSVKKFGKLTAFCEKFFLNKIIMLNWIWNCLLLILGIKKYEKKRVDEGENNNYFYFLLYLFHIKFISNEQFKSTCAQILTYKKWFQLPLSYLIKLVTNRLEINIILKMFSCVFYCNFSHCMYFHLDSFAQIKNLRNYYIYYFQYQIVVIFMTY